MTRVACLLLALALCSGCLYANVRVPLDTNYHGTELGQKVGMAETKSVMWLFAWGDAGTKAAAESAGITTIKHADREVLSVCFGLFTRVRTIVYGD